MAGLTPAACCTGGVRSGGSPHTARVRERPSQACRPLAVHARFARAKEQGGHTKAARARARRLPAGHIRACAALENSPIRVTAVQPELLLAPHQLAFRARQTEW